MEIINTDPNKIAIQFTKDEFRGITNTLNEVLHGFGWDFSGTDWTKQEAIQFRDDIETNCRFVDDNKIICSFTKEEILFLMQAINATIDELEWEYSIRMGYTIEEAQQLLGSLQGSVQALS